MSAQDLKRLRLGIWAAGLLMLVLYLIVAVALDGSDYAQAVAEHEWACQMISEGVWPKDLMIDCPEPVQSLASNSAI
ncbi:hypothetical protein WG29040_23555 [Pseudomonas sp. PAMC 29040]|uniref:hypothetical protein n=1 Tax=Pseudomonas sp. PAMC 29040 TaxID=2498450 RepID=UPI000FA9FDEA|nr:hypothetical protein [Pseudomonas sp. PAMC 29040]RUT30917.1 hypothetical protein WG29040_23555 [Pseudomonas sp. PAMC 29040]